jgi:methionyl aminopeptidase
MPNPVPVKTREEIELMRESAQLVSKTLGMLAGHIKPSVTTLELDKLAEEFIRDHGGIPAFLGMYDFPNTLCTSPNNQIVHGIPNDKPLKNGDILSIDCGVLMNGFYGDHAYTFEVGNVSKTIKDLLKATEESLYKGVEQCRAGNTTGDIGKAIQSHVEGNGYSVVREFFGHGLGSNLHEDPPVYNYEKKIDVVELKEGMVLAIEPMVNLGKKDIRRMSDGWTVLTKDRKVSAHFEHDVAIVDGKPDLLSTFDYVYKALDIVF